MITLPTFDVSKKAVFENDTNCLITVTYEIKYHPNNVLLLKILLYQASSTDISLPSNTEIYFIQYDIILSI